MALRSNPRLSRLTSPQYRAALWGLTALLFVVIGSSLGFGSVSLAWADTWMALWRPAEVGPHVATIVRELRVPRVLAAALVGGTLAVIGATLQAVMRNPLADPYILGISSGASVGAVLAAGGAVWLFGPLGSLPQDLVRFVGSTGLAFVTALLSVVLVYRVAEREGRAPPLRLLLAGVAFSAFAGAVTALMLYLMPDAVAVRGLVFWLLGGFSSVDTRALWAMGLAAVPVLIALWATARWQNVLLLGEEAAHGLGLDVTAVRRWLILVSALGTGAIVVHSGAVGFVGLIVPHAVRPLTGPDHRRLLPACFLVGATLLISVDTLARTVLAPDELPVGILTGLLGAPFFLWLLRRGAADGVG